MLIANIESVAPVIDVFVFSIVHHAIGANCSETFTDVDYVYLIFPSACMFRFKLSFFLLFNIVRLILISF